MSPAGRATPRRAATRPGLGLGFFIAKTLLERSGATLALQNRTVPQRGAIVRVHWRADDFERRAPRRRERIEQRRSFGDEPP